MQEINQYVSELQQSELLHALPLETLLPALPKAGKNYRRRRGVLFLGQDPGVLVEQKDKPEKTAEFFQKHHRDWDAFWFEDPVNSFLNWYLNDRFYFWEVPIRVMLKDKTKTGSSFYKQEELKEQHEALSSFACGNIGALIYPDYFAKLQPRETYAWLRAFNAQDYERAFKCAQAIFGTFDFFQRNLEPKHIVVMTNRFEPEQFFKDKQNVRETQADDFLWHYTIPGEYDVHLHWTYHPSYLKRKKKVDRVCSQLIDRIAAQ